jgi:hypothetical protein
LVRGLPKDKGKPFRRSGEAIYRPADRFRFSDLEFSLWACLVPLGFELCFFWRSLRRFCFSAPSRMFLRFASGHFSPQFLAAPIGLLVIYGGAAVEGFRALRWSSGTVATNTE